MLNILPPEIIQYAIWEKNYRYLKKIIILIWLIILIPFLISIIEYYYISKSYIPNLTDLESSSDKIQNYSQEVNEINELSNRITVIQLEHVNPNILIYQFLQLIPDNVIINNLSLSLKSKTIGFSGTAATREDLLQMQLNFSKNNTFINIHYPVNIFAEKDNIEFNLSGEIKYEN